MEIIQSKFTLRRLYPLEDVCVSVLPCSATFMMVKDSTRKLGIVIIAVIIVMVKYTKPHDVIGDLEVFGTLYLRLSPT